jgi:hypothetical protein
MDVQFPIRHIKLREKTKKKTQIGLPVTNKQHRRYRYIYPFERCVTTTLTSSSVSSPLDVSVLVASQLLLRSLVSL